jgi:hypothetical protein
MDKTLIACQHSQTSFNVTLEASKPHKSVWLVMVKYKVTVFGSGGIAPTFLTSATDGGELSFHALATLPQRKEHPVPTGQEVGWGPELVRMRDIGDSYSCRESKPGHPAQSNTD